MPLLLDWKSAAETVDNKGVEANAQGTLPQTSLAARLRQFCWHYDASRNWVRFPHQVRDAPVVKDGKIQIDTSTQQPTPRRRKRPWVVWMVVAIVGLFCLADLIAIYLPRVEQEAWPAGATLDEVALEHETQSEPNGKNSAVDESNLQWISPTTGPPLSLEYVPLGTQVILHLRPAELMAHPEGEKVLAALGPWGIEAAVQIEQLSGAKLAEIETLLVALNHEEGEWQCTMRLTLVEPWTQQQLEQQTAEITNQQRALFLPAAGQGRVLVSCPQAMLAELEERGDEPAILARDLERLLPDTDSARTATLLMPTKFLDTAGSELFLNGGEALRSAFLWVVPDNASAVAISLDWHQDFFCELAATIVQNAPARRFSATLQRQLSTAEQHIASLLATDPPPHYSQAIAERFPAMLKTMSQYTRTSQEDGIAIARCYLPIQAGHNLLLAAELTTSRSRLNAIPTSTIKPPAASLTTQLDQVTTLSFPKETLENALQILADDLKIPIQIAGRDLQLEGITKNQTLTLDLRDKPTQEILVELLRLANPDRSATGSHDPRQKLVFVIRDGRVIVTTRSAAAQRGEELPEVFRANNP